jgi:hypothetical protein
MIKRYQFGGMTLTFRRGESQYSSSITLDKSVEKNLRVVKQETDGLDTNETRYSLMQGEEELALIRGYYKSPTKFYIERIENATGDKISGFRNLSQVYRIMEDDLRENRVEYVTTLSLAKLAHIAVKRYGFYDTEGKSYEDLKNSWLKMIPWKAVSLEKRL